MAGRDDEGEYDPEGFKSSRMRCSIMQLIRTTMPRGSTILRNGVVGQLSTQISISTCPVTISIAPKTGVRHRDKGMGRKRP
jgi:hypothetical protein